MSLFYSRRYRCQTTGTVKGSLNPREIVNLMGAFMRSLTFPARAESDLKDLQESYECAMTYTQLVKQELARISLAGDPSRTV